MGNKQSCSRGQGQSRGRGRGRGRGQNYGTRPPRQQSSPQTDYYTCGNCNGKHPPRKCPAWGKYCNYCNRIGHFKIACRKLKSQQNVHLAETEL